MKKFTLLLSFFLLSSLFAFGTPRRIILDNKGPIDNRSGFQLYFDMPQVFYDDDPKSQEIIIDGGGVVSYYDVEITSASTSNVEISTTVNGTYDSFDVSSLTAGSHVITIESPSGNIFEGTFVTY